MLAALVLMAVAIGTGRSTQDIDGTFRMPPIFAYDDFNQCQQRYYPAVYCYTRTILRRDLLPKDVVIPEPERTERIVSHHRRDLIESGICVNRCEEEVATLTPDQQRHLYQPKFEVNFPYIFSKELFPTLESYRSNYQTLTNICVNKRLRDQYNVTGYSEFEYCRTNEMATVNRSYDTLDVLFVLCCVAIVGAALVCTALDLCAAGTSRANFIVATFSVRRNWNRLLEDPKPGLHERFHHIDGLRVIVNVLVILLHSFLVVGIAPYSNYTYLEWLVSHPINQVYLSSSAFLVQIFFAISGFLLTLHFMDDVRNNRIDSGYVQNKIVNRLVRLLPVYLFYLLFTVSLMDRMDRTAFGYRLYHLEYRICRKYWWSNVLFINNLSTTKELCMMHSWYLGADMQLFLMALGFLVLLYRFPRWSKLLFTVAILMSIVVPAYLMHSHQLAPVIGARLSSFKFTLMFDTWLRKLYMPGYANTGSYVAGIVAGSLYQKVMDKKVDIESSKIYRALDYISMPLVLALVLPSFIWYNVNITKPSIFVTTFGTLYRNCIGIYVAICFIRSFQPTQGLVRRILSSKLLTSMGKLTYSVYIVHDSALRHRYRNVNSIIEVDLTEIIMSVLHTCTLSYAAGFLLYMLVEQPISAVLKRILDDMRSSRRKHEHGKDL